MRRAFFHLWSFASRRMSEVDRAPHLTIFSRQLNQKDPMRSFRLVYDEWLHRRPLLTKMVTSSVLFGIGDRLSQKVEKLSKADEEMVRTTKEEVETGRLLSKSATQTVRMMVWGGLLLTPMMHNWYNLVDKVFRGTSRLATAKKVVADMVFVAPQMPLWFFTSTGFMAGQPLQEAFGDAVEKQPTTLLANYLLWPAANNITYGVMPLEYRLLFTNCVNVGWASILSYMANHPVPTLPFLPSLKRKVGPSEETASKQVDLRRRISRRQSL